MIFKIRSKALDIMVTNTHYQISKSPQEIRQQLVLDDVFFCDKIQPKLSSKTCASLKTSNIDSNINLSEDPSNIKAFHAIFDYFSKVITAEEALDLAFESNTPSNLPLSEKQSSQLLALLNTKITACTQSGGEISFTYKELFNALAKKGAKPRLILKSHRESARVIYPNCEVMKVIKIILMNDPKFKEMPCEELEEIMLDLIRNDSDWEMELTPIDNRPPEQLVLEAIEEMSRRKNKKYEKESQNNVPCLTSCKPIGDNAFKFSFAIPQRFKKTNHFPGDLRLDVVFKLRLPDSTGDNTIKYIDSFATLEAIYEKQKGAWTATTIKTYCGEPNYDYFAGIQSRFLISKKISEREKRIKYLESRSQRQSYWPLWQGEHPRAQGRLLEFIKQFLSKIDKNSDVYRSIIEILKRPPNSEWLYSLYKPDANKIPFISLLELAGELEDFNNSLLTDWQKQYGFSKAHMFFQERLKYLYVAYCTYCNDPQYKYHKKESLQALQLTYKNCVNNLLLSKIKATGANEQKIKLFQIWLDKDKINCIKTCWQYWLELFVKDIDFRENHLTKWLDYNNLLVISYTIALKELSSDICKTKSNSQGNPEQVIADLRLLERYATLANHLELLSESEKEAVNQVKGILSKDLLEEKQEQLKNCLKNYIKSHCREPIEDSSMNLMSETKEILDNRSRILSEDSSELAKLEALMFCKSATKVETKKIPIKQFEAMNQYLQEDNLLQAYRYYKNLSKLEGYQEKQSQIKNHFLSKLAVWRLNLEENYQDQGHDFLLSTGLTLQIIQWATQVNQTEELILLWNLTYKHLLKAAGSNQLEAQRLFSEERITLLLNFSKTELQKTDSVLLQGLLELIEKLKVLLPEQTLQEELSHLTQIGKTLEAKCRYQACFNDHAQQSLDELSMSEINYELNLIKAFKYEHEKLTEKVPFICEDRLKDLLSVVQKFVEEYRPEWNRSDLSGHKKDLSTHLSELLKSAHKNLYLDLYSCSPIDKLFSAVGDFEHQRKIDVISGIQKKRLHELYLSIAFSSENYLTAREYYDKLNAEPLKQKRVWPILAHKFFKKYQFVGKDATPEVYEKANELLKKFEGLFPESQLHANPNYKDLNEKRTQLLYQIALLSLQLPLEKFIKEDIVILSNFKGPSKLRVLYRAQEENILNNLQYLKAFLKLDDSNDMGFDIILMEISCSLRKKKLSIKKDCLICLLEHIDKLKDKEKVKLSELQGLMHFILNRLAKQRSIDVKNLAKLLEKWEQFNLPDIHSNAILTLFTNWLKSKKLLVAEEYIVSRAALCFAAQKNTKYLDEFLQLMFEYKKMYGNFPRCELSDQEKFNNLLKKLSDKDSNQAYKECFLISLRKHLHQQNHSYLLSHLETIKQYQFTGKMLLNNMFSWLDKKVAAILFYKYTPHIATVALIAITSIMYFIHRYRDMNSWIYMSIDYPKDYEGNPTLKGYVADVRLQKKVFSGVQTFLDKICKIIESDKGKKSIALIPEGMHEIEDFSCPEHINTTEFLQDLYRSYFNASCSMRQYPSFRKKEMDRLFDNYFTYNQRATEVSDVVIRKNYALFRALLKMMKQPYSQSINSFLTVVSSVKLLRVTLFHLMLYLNDCVFFLRAVMLDCLRIR